MAFNGYHAVYTGAFDTLDAALTDRSKVGPFPNFISGYAMSIQIQPGYYASFKFTVPATSTTGQMQFTSDPSVGDPGTISVSTRPGAFTVADGVVQGAYGPCVYNDGGGNSLWMGVGVDCPLQPGQTYYLNFADVDKYGNQGPTSKIGYQETAGGR